MSTTLDAHSGDASDESGSNKSPEHIKRPRNSFICFRSYYVEAARSVESHNANLSKDAGAVWRGFTDEEKAPWVEIARLERLAFIKKYPDYKFAPTRRKRPAKTRASPKSNLARRAMARDSFMGNYKRKPIVELRRVIQVAAGGVGGPAAMPRTTRGKASSRAKKPKPLVELVVQPSTVEISSPVTPPSSPIVSVVIYSSRSAPLIIICRVIQLSLL